MIIVRTKFDFIKLEVTMINREKAAEVREAYTRELRDSFRAAAGEFSQKYQIHHILPVSLGGDNKFSNLALVLPDLHQEIHREIEGQTYGMTTGCRRMIHLPFMRDYVWKL